MRMIVRGYVVAAFAVVLLPSSSPAQHLPSHSVAPAQQRLLQLTAADDLNTDVAAPIQSAIAALKSALVRETDTVIAQAPARTTAAFVQEHVAAVLPSPAIGKPSDKPGSLDQMETGGQTAGLYGGELKIAVTEPRSSLLLVQESFDIACGDDNVLMAYSHAGGAWTRILLWQSQPYASISQAFGDFYQALLLRPQHNGHPILLVLHGTPWCTSTMSSFSMDVFALEDPSNPAPLWHGEHDYRRADADPPLTVRATADGFEVRTSVSAGGEGVTRKGVIRYTVAANGVHRVEPIGMNARDSLYEWLEMPRTEAAEFADQPAGTLTWTMFRDFTYRDKPKGASVPYPSIDAVRACKGDPTSFQAEVSSQIFNAAWQPRPGPAYFVQLRQVPNGYRIQAVTRVKSIACNGPDLMAGR